MKYKKHEGIEKNLRVEDGDLVLEDGTSVQEYIKSWQEVEGIPNGTKVNVILHDHLTRLAEDAEFLRRWGA